MKDLKGLILGGIAIVGFAVAGYRAYEAKKMRDTLQRETIIEIEPDKVEVSSRK